MDFKAVSRLLRIIPSRPEEAITVKQLEDKWHSLYIDTPTERSFQRYMKQLTDFPQLVNVIEGKPQKFYLRLSGVSSWFMSEEMALNLILTNQSLTSPIQSLEGVAAQSGRAMAEDVVAVGTRHSRNLRKYLRLLPDGFGRMNATIEPQVLSEVFKALSSGNKISVLGYTKQNGETKDYRDLNPQGLVMKDGTFYLVVSKGLNNYVFTLALHRASNAEASPNQARPIPGFDLDTHIKDTHRFGHVDNNSKQLLDLQLRVKAGAIFHFQERPMNEGQSIEGPQDDGCYIVKALLPHTMELVPFLLSLFDAIEVLAPESIRTVMKEKAEGMAKLYCDA